MKILISAFFSFVCITFANANALLTDLYGEKIPFDSLKGKWVLINYWASWCQPCLDEIHELNQFYQNKKENVALFAVNFDYLPVEEQIQLTKKLKIRYISLLEDPGSQLGLERVRGVPATFVFNPQGKLSTVLYGSQTIATLDEAIRG